MHYIISWIRVLLEKLIVTQLVKKSLAFIEPKGSLPCLKSATGPYLEPDESSAYLPLLFLLCMLHVLPISASLI